MTTLTEREDETTIKLPSSTWYRRLVTAAKQFRFLNTMFKNMHLSRRLEIKGILELAAFSPQDTICDIGCGDGYWSSIFSKKTKNVFALDPFPEDLEKARLFATSNLHLINSVGENIPLGDSSVNKVVSVCVFEHCFDDQQTFREIHRILESDGKLFATVDSMNAPSFSPEYLQWHRVACYINQYYTHETITNKLEQAGFTKVKTRYIFTSRLAIWWSKFSNKLGAAVFPLGLLIFPIIVWRENPDADSGCKIVVEATKR